MSGHQQASIFEFLYDDFVISKPIRLIELFSGIGAQAKALENLGADFEHWKTCDWAVPSIHAYAAIHHFHLPGSNSDIESLDRQTRKFIVSGVSSNYNSPLSEQQLSKKSDEWINDLIRSINATNNLINIMDVHSDDLEIRDLDKYTYVMTYSFPCQDLSLAGHKKGMSVSQAVGGTRSGLLWEVERILDECAHDNCLPQVLIMENVPEVVGVKNIKDFQKWRAKLESLGYSNYCEILNAKNYGIPQNRRRCFMVSVLGEYNFTFPRPRKLTCTLSDFLDKEVDSKYICNKKFVDYLTGVNQKPSKYDRGKVFERNLNPDKSVAATITCRAGQRPTDNYIPVESSLKEQLCDKLCEEGKVQNGDVIRHSYSSNRLNNGDKNMGRIENHEGLSPTLDTRCDCLGVVLDAENIKIRNATKQGFLEAEEGDGVDISTRMHHHRGTVQKGTAQTITTMGGENVGVVCSESVFSDIEESLLTKDGNIHRYIGSDKIDEFKEGQMATVSFPNGYGHGPRTHNESIALNTIDRPIVKKNLIIRKLTPLECLKLMGFEKYDYNQLVGIGQSDAQIYHEAGDSIVVTVLMSIFGKLLDLPYEDIVDEYVDSLKTCDCK